MRLSIKKGFSISASAISIVGLASCVAGDPAESEAAQDVAEFKDAPPLSAEEFLITDILENVGAGWVFAHDLNFNTLTSGRIQVFDVLAENKNFKGQLNAAQFASFAQSPERSELYVAETYYSRGVRGERTDLIAIYDLLTLNLKEEIILPNNNRGMNVTQKGNFQLSGDGKFAFVFTFTPASGVAVIDLDTRTVVNEIPVPGCTMAYPFRDRGFAMLCGDGGMIAIDLDASGQVAKEHVTDFFHDIDEHPMFMKYARVGNQMYWPTFTGRLQSVDFGSEAPVPGDLWDFVGDADYLPSGWQVITAAPNGHVYVLMRAGAAPGDHKFGGDEVWELDPQSKTIVRKFKLATSALSIEALRTELPTLVVTAAEDMSLDVYNLNSGERIRSIGGFMSSTPFVLHASEFGE